MTQNNLLWLLSSIANVCILACLVRRRKQLPWLLAIETSWFAWGMVENAFYFMDWHNSWMAFEFVNMAFRLTVAASLPKRRWQSVMLTDLYLLSVVGSCGVDYLWLDGLDTWMLRVYYADAWLNVFIAFALAFWVHYGHASQPKGDSHARTVARPEQAAPAVS